MACSNKQNPKQQDLGELKIRCYCCNKILKPSESTRRFKESDTFTDMCDECLSTISDIDTIEGEGNDEELFDDDGNPIGED